MTTKNNNIKFKRDKLINALREKGVIRISEIVDLGLSREYVRKLFKSGIIEKAGRGLYRIAESPLTEHHSLVEASLRVPQGVICLISALQFHNLTTQMPFEVSIAIKPYSRMPKENGIPLRIFRFSQETFKNGIEEHILEGVNVRIYSPAKTIADCFKFRNKIGIDITVEALKDCIAKRMCNIDDIWKYAELCRVVKIIRPYLEALA